MSKMATENENKKWRILYKLHNNLPWFGNLIKFRLNRCCFGEESIIMNEKKSAEVLCGEPAIPPSVTKLPAIMNNVLW